MRLVRATMFGSLVMFLASCMPGHSFPALNHPPTRESLIDSVVVLVTQEDGGVLAAACSGVFISETEVLTAAHCVERTVVVTLEILPGLVLELEETSPDSPLGDTQHVALHGQTVDAVSMSSHEFTVTRFDRERDLAVLTAKDSRLPHHTVAVLHSGARPQVGDQVMAVGHPLGLLYNVTPGVISREMGDLEPMTEETVELVFASADIYFGNSGGPLFNADGEIIGIASFIADSQSHLGGWIAYTEVRAFLSERH